MDKNALKNTSCLEDKVQHLTKAREREDRGIDIKYTEHKYTEITNSCFVVTESSSSLESCC